MEKNLTNKYTDEKNIQMLIYLLKENNIRKVIVNPGTMNMSFVASIESDNFFELYSCVDERSACYMACGLACDSGEPVVLTCTGATASRNYLPGMTEAFYRKIPILAITATPFIGNTGHDLPQTLDRSNQLNDTYKYSAYIPTINSKDDEWFCNIAINKAILELKHNGGGPVHLNIETKITKVFNVKELPSFRRIDRVSYINEFPKIDGKKKIGIFVGNHQKWTNELLNAVDEFCEKYNAVVICDSTSNYNGKYKILFNILCDQEKYRSSLNSFDLLIQIGNISGSYMTINVNEVWRVNPDGELKDTFKVLKYVFEMDELFFFNKYNSLTNRINDTSLFNSLKKEVEEIELLAEKCDFPFSNIWIAREMINALPENSTVHLSILNTLRSWNYFHTNKNINIFCNTGGFGIDGIMSTAVGASFNKRKDNCYCVIGDLAFFYDMNSLGNKYINNKLRILLINNGCGTEFYNYSHPANVLGNSKCREYIAAKGHYGNKSNILVKNYVENLGFEYLSAYNKNDFEEKINYFVSENTYEKPIVFEVFTDSQDESNALYKIRTLKTTINDEIKLTIKNAMPNKIKNKIKLLLGR